MEKVKNIVLQGTASRTMTMDIFFENNSNQKPVIIYAHGFNAIRSEGSGANQIALLLQWDLDAKMRGKSRFFTPNLNPYRSRGGERIFRE